LPGIFAFGISRENLLFVLLLIWRALLADNACRNLGKESIDVEISQSESGKLKSGMGWEAEADDWKTSRTRMLKRKVNRGC
jgi:hypothetical protein